MPEENFRLPGCSYDELVKIISAYGHLNKPAAPADVGKLTGMHPTDVSRNNAFLLALEILEGGKKKVTTSTGKSLASALEHEIPQEIRDKWREIAMASEFLQKLVSAVKIRKGMETSTLQSHVAYSAGQPKTPQVMAGARAVVEILMTAGLLREDEDGKVVTAPGDVLLESAAAKARPRISSDQQAKDLLHQGIPVTIQIQIQCAANEIEELVPKLRALLEEISTLNAPRKTRADE